MDTASNASDPAKAVETWPYDLSRAAGAGCERREWLVTLIVGGVTVVLS